MLGFAQIALMYVVPFLVVLTVVITFHEFGHFLVARLFGVAVDRFSIGFGRAIVSRTDKHGIEWRLGWMPLGGYVRFAGDESVASVPDAEDLKDLKREVVAREGPQALQRYFHFKPLWQRALVVAAGPVANFVLSTLLFAVVAMAVGDIMLKARVGDVQPNTPAAHAGFKAGDLIVSANGRQVREFGDVTSLVVLSTGEPIEFTVERGGQLVDLTATPIRATPKGPCQAAQEGLGCLGLKSSIARGDIVVRHYGPIQALAHGARRTGEVVGLSVTYIERMVLGRESGSQLSGIIGMAGATGRVASDATRDAPDFTTGAIRLVLTLVSMAAFISAAVGFANLLPIPVLDGGHLLFYGYEALARRPLSANVQAAGYRVGFALLIGLMLFVTWNDLQRLRVIHLIGGLFS